MTNSQFPMTNQTQNPQFDLTQRTTNFGLAVLDFCKQIPKTEISRPLIVQLVRSGTSIGANYSEADDAESKRDFQHKIGIAKKEAKETKYWLHLIAHSFPDTATIARPLWQEAKELTLIFAAIIKSSRSTQ